MLRRRLTTGGGTVPRARIPGLRATASEKIEKRSVPARRAAFATSQGAWLNSPGNHHRAGAVRR